MFLTHPSFVGFIFFIWLVYLYISAPVIGSDVALSTQSQYSFTLAAKGSTLINAPKTKVTPIECESVSSPQTYMETVDWIHVDLIETLYRENVSFRDRDLKRQIPCHTASKNLDAQLLRNDTSFLSNLLCKSPLINYSPTISFVFFSRSIDMKREFWRFRQKSEHRFPPCLHAELPTTCYNHSIVTYLCQYSWRVWTSPVRGRDCM